MLKYYYSTVDTNLSSNALFHPDLEFADTEPDSELNGSDVSEEEINENMVLDE